MPVSKDKPIHHKRLKNTKIWVLFNKLAKGQFKIKNIQKILWTNMWILYVYCELPRGVLCGEFNNDSGKNSWLVE